MPEDLLTEMAVREVWTQCHFAEIAYSNIERKGDLSNDVVFSSIHSFLSHCANVSKFLWSRAIATAVGRTIAEVLGVPETSCIRDRKFRNALEHYDEHLVEWASRRSPQAIFDHCIGPRNLIGTEDGSPVDVIYVRHFNPGRDTFTLLGEDLDLKALLHEVADIRQKAEAWVNRARLATRQ